MTSLLSLPRLWLLMGALAVGSVAGGVVVLTANNGGDSHATNVLGEKVTGSGSSTAAGGNGQGNNGNGNGNGGSTGNASPGKAFTISGAANELFPGALTKLHLTVTNPNTQAMTVTDLKATLQSVSGAPSCTATTANLTIQNYTGEQFDVDKNASKLSTGYIGITLPSTVSNACQDATFNLSYTGTAVQK